ncbi:MAG: signal peptide peptidase SppA [Ahrensia sp.]|nr:signal peptide peptidase SppA [Ahrensia sp.]
MRADDIIDRQRLRRKVTFWRIISVLLAVVGVLGLAGLLIDGESIGQRGSDHVAKIKIEGTITEDEELLERLAEIEKSERVRGVILAIDSPGGTTVGGEAIYEAVRKIAQKKPVVAQVGTLAASAGYMIAAGADQIVARQSSIVGSIGVIFQYPNFEQLLTNLGIDMRAIKSSPLKAEPSFYGQTPAGAEEMIERMILDSFTWFKDIVTERRKFTSEKTDTLADGSIFTGRQAKDNGLIDLLGGEEVARSWLTEKGVDEKLETIEWAKPNRSSNFLFPFAVAEWISSQFGIKLGPDALNNRIYEHLMLDGLLSVWHVPAK